MVLPLLGGLLGSAIAGTGAMGGVAAAMSPLIASSIGSGLGSFIETGDIKEAGMTGLGSLAGGALLGGTAAGAINAGQGAAGAGGAEAAELAKGFANIGGNPTELASLGAKDLMTADYGKYMISDPGRISGMVGAAAGPAMTYTPDPGRDFSGGGRYGGKESPAPGRSLNARTGGGIGEFDYRVQPNYGMRDGGEVNHNVAVNNATPNYSPIPSVAERMMMMGAGGGGGMYGSAMTRKMAKDQFGPSGGIGSLADAFGRNTSRNAQPAGPPQMNPQLAALQNRSQLPPMSQMREYMQASPGNYGLAEGGLTTMVGAEAPTEKVVISDAISAIEGTHPAPELALAKFVEVYGEDALMQLVESVSNGEMQDSAMRSQGMVDGPPVGGDIIPARNVDSGMDVLLEDGEYVVPREATQNIGPENLDRMVQGSM